MTITADTPPVADLLSHWQAVTDRNETIGAGWAVDRSAAILNHIADLEAELEQLRGTLEWNRQAHKRDVAAFRFHIEQLELKVAEGAA